MIEKYFFVSSAKSRYHISLFADDHSMLNVKIILASVREGRFGDKPAAWIFDHAKKTPDLEVELLDLKEFPMPFFNAPVSPSMIKEPYTHPVVVQWTAKIAEADAFIIVTPEYNHAPPASLKNAMDWVYQEWNKKPVTFVAYGGVGGARSIEQLKEVAVELQMAPMRNNINITFDYMMKAFQDSNIDPIELLKPFDEKAKGMIDQLIWWGNALKEARNNL